VAGFLWARRGTRNGRKPKAGGKRKVGGKYVPSFKPCKELRDRANICG
ncbi:HU family DNA-binding protein, partial [Escherichia coli]|nr:HU family DNA-binding protein [Escherichia coli]